VFKVEGNYMKNQKIK